VVIGAPFHCTDELEMKPVPVIVIEVAAEPATAEDGVIAVTAGTGFEPGAGFVGTAVPPPQPVKIQTKIQDKTTVKEKNLTRFMGNFHLSHK